LKDILRCFLEKVDQDRWSCDLHLEIPPGRSAIAEVYPALWSRCFANEGRTGDQHDAHIIAAWLSRADRDGCKLARNNDPLRGNFASKGGGLHILNMNFDTSSPPEK